MPIGKKLFRTETCADSMAWAKETLHQAPDGAVFLANVLTQAQGRQNRVWQVHPDQLMVTFILKPPQLAAIAPEDLHIRLNQLTMAMALGILDPLKAFGAKLKWPNDFVIDGKKIGGILVHVVWHAEHIKGIIIGFAINVNNEFDQSDPLYPIATSLKTVSGTQQDRRAIYKDMLASLNAWYGCWQHGHYMHIYKHWKNEQACLGAPIQVHQKDGSIISGLAQQVMPNGDLLLLDAAGKQHIVSFYHVEEIKIA